jgi:hypothetical protein
MNISKMIASLVEFDKTERQVVVALHYRADDGTVIKTEYFPVNAVFSHRDKVAEVYIEHSQRL